MRFILIDFAVSVCTYTLTTEGIKRVTCWCVCLNPFVFKSDGKLQYTSLGTLRSFGLIFITF